MPGIHRVSKDLLEDLDQPFLSSSLLWYFKLQDLLEFFGRFEVYQRHARRCRMSIDAVRAVRAIGASFVRGTGVVALVCGADKGDQKVLDGF